MKDAKSMKNDNFLKAYDEHSDGLFRYALWKTSNRNVALDLTQEAFTKVWEYISADNEIDNLKAFLYRTLGNLIIDYYRKKKSESLDTMIERGFDEGYDSHSKDEDKLMGESIWYVVEKLDDKYKEVITLRYMNDMSVKEIADILKESENHVSVKIHRALEKIKEQIKI